MKQRSAEWDSGLVKKDCQCSDFTENFGDNENALELGPDLRASQSSNLSASDYTASEHTCEKLRSRIIGISKENEITDDECRSVRNDDIDDREQWLVDFIQKVLPVVEFSVSLNRCSKKRKVSQTEVFVTMIEKLIDELAVNASVRTTFHLLSDVFQSLLECLRQSLLHSSNKSVFHQEAHERRYKENELLNSMARDDDEALAKSRAKSEILKAELAKIRASHKETEALLLHFKIENENSSAVRNVVRNLLKSKVGGLCANFLAHWKFVEQKMEKMEIRIARTRKKAESTLLYRKNERKVRQLPIWRKITELECNVKSLTEELGNANMLTRELQFTVDVQTVKIQQAQKKQLFAEGKEFEQKGEISSQIDLLKEKDLRIQILQTEKAQLISQIKRLNSKIEEGQTRENKIKFKLNEGEARLKNLQNKFQKLKEKINDSREDNIQLREEIKRLEIETKQREEQLDSLSGIQQQAMLRYQKLNESRLGWKCRTEKWELNYKKLKDDLQNALERIDTSENDLDYCRKWNDLYKEHIKETGEIISALRSENIELSEQNETLADEIDSLSLECKATANSCEKASARADKMEYKYLKMSEQCQKIQERYDWIACKNEKIENELDDVRYHRLKERNKELYFLKNADAKASNNSSDLHGEDPAKEDKHSLKMNWLEMKELTVRNQILVKQVRKLKREKIELEEELDMLSSKTSEVTQLLMAEVKKLRLEKKRLLASAEYGKLDIPGNKLCMRKGGDEGRSRELNQSTGDMDTSRAQKSPVLKSRDYVVLTEQDRKSHPPKQPKSPLQDPVMRKPKTSASGLNSSNSKHINMQISEKESNAKLLRSKNGKVEYETQSSRVKICIQEKTSFELGKVSGNMSTKDECFTMTMNKDAKIKGPLLSTVERTKMGLLCSDSQVKGAIKSVDGDALKIEDEPTQSELDIDESSKSSLTPPTLANSLSSNFSLSARSANVQRSRYRENNLDKEIARLENEVLNLRNQLMSSRKTNSDLTLRSSKIYEKLREAQVKIKSQSLTIKMLSEEIENCKFDASVLWGVSQTSEVSSDHHESLQKRLEDEIDDNLQLREEIRRLEIKIQKQEDEVNAISGLQQSALIRYKELNDSRLAWKERTENWEHKFKLLNDDLEQAQRKNQTTKEKFEFKITENHLLLEQIKEAGEMINELMQENRELGLKCENINEEVESQRLRCRTITERYELASCQAEKVEWKYMQLSEEYQKYQERCEWLVSRKSEFETKLKHTRNEPTECTKQLVLHKSKETREMSGNKVCETDHINDLSIQNSKMRKEIATLKFELGSIREELGCKKEEFLNEVSQFRETIAMLESNNQEAKKRIILAETQIDEAICQKEFREKQLQEAVMIIEEFKESSADIQLHNSRGFVAKEGTRAAELRRKIDESVRQLQDRFVAKKSILKNPAVNFFMNDGNICGTSRENLLTAASLDNQEKAGKFKQTEQNYDAKIGVSETLKKRRFRRKSYAKLESTQANELSEARAQVEFLKSSQKSMKKELVAVQKANIELTKQVFNQSNELTSKMRNKYNRSITKLTKKLEVKNRALRKEKSKNEVLKLKHAKDDALLKKVLELEEKSKEWAESVVTKKRSVPDIMTSSNSSTSSVASSIRNMGNRGSKRSKSISTDRRAEAVVTK